MQEDNRKKELYEEAYKKLQDNLKPKQMQATKEIASLYRRFVKSAAKNYELSQKFIVCAKIDLDNAKLLNRESGNRHRLPLIVYLMQQSIEKYVKAYCLIFGAISPSSIKKKIGHASGQAFVKMLRNQDMQKLFDRMQQISDFIYTKEVSEDLKRIELEKSAKDMEEKIANNRINESDVSNLLDEFEKVKKILKESLNNANYSEGFLDKIFSSNLGSIFKSIIGKDKISNHAQIILLQYDLICFLYPLIFITPQHVNSTRYPIIDKTQNLWPDDYVKGKPPIVSERERILRNLDGVHHNITTLMRNIKFLSQLSDEKLEKKIDKAIIENK